MTLRNASVLYVLSSLLAAPNVVTAQFEYCQQGLQDSGANYLICPPLVPWNGDLLIFAHGYIPCQNEACEPTEMWKEQLNLNGPYLNNLANLLGFAFAGTSFSTDGFAVTAGLDDVVDLVDVFSQVTGQVPEHVFLIGSSQGGLITVLGLELADTDGSPVFDGGVSVCGPIGDYAMQINYVGDFHVIFDYLFPGVLPVDPLGGYDISQAEWFAPGPAGVANQIRAAIWTDVPRTVQLLRITRAPVDFVDPSNLLASIDNTVVTLMWYSVFGTNDALDSLCAGYEAVCGSDPGPCQPYDNTTRWYRRSGFDLLLNLTVDRYEANDCALLALEGFQTTGNLQAPVVTGHTLLDEVVPYRQQLRYRLKNLLRGTSELNTHIPVVRYGHCNFTVEELLFAFALMYEEATGQPLPGLAEVMGSTNPDAPMPIAGPDRLPPLSKDVKQLMADIDTERLLRELKETPPTEYNVHASRE